MLCPANGEFRQSRSRYFEAVILCGIGFQAVVFFGEFDRLEAYPTQNIKVSSGLCEIESSRQKSLVVLDDVK